jgi:coatomer subunit delta
VASTQLSFHTPALVPLLDHTCSHSGSLKLIVGGDDASVFWPVNVGFVRQGVLAGIKVGEVGGGMQVGFSADSVVMTEECLVV